MTNGTIQLRFKRSRDTPNVPIFSRWKPVEPINGELSELTCPDEAMQVMRRRLIPEMWEIMAETDTKNGRIYTLRATSAQDSLAMQEPEIYGGVDYYHLKIG